MKRSILLPLLMGLLLTGCGKAAAPTISAAVQTLATEPAFTVSGDGDPTAVTCQGSYTGSADADAAAARLGDAVLTNEELSIWYWAEVSQYLQSGAEPAPEPHIPLDAQPCSADPQVNSWQQYFLKTALNRWHTAQALIRHSQDTPLPLEEAYQGNPAKHETYMTGMPATEFLYGCNAYYTPNTRHREYLEGLSQTFSGARLDMVRDLNYSYMYFTQLTYAQQPQQEEATALYEPVASFRQILLLPGEGESIGACTRRAEETLSQWREDRKSGEGTFAQLARQLSQDPGSAVNGGLYENLRQEQLAQPLAQWCFEADRQPGDTTLIATDYGVHILYYVSGGNQAALDARRASQSAGLSELLAGIRERYPMEVDYSSIVLHEKTGEESLEELLYPDIAHERFPEIPLYLQQDYPDTMYGDYKLYTNGCGITSLAMLASYLTDDELTPPEMCARYGRYSTKTGTSGSLFEDAPPELGFYLVKKTYDWREARDYMLQGHPVIVCQYRGYWTSGGHYLVLERMTEDGMVQVRDSNIYNYAKLPRHMEDKFPWDTLSTAGQGYWIYEKKVTATPACTRCGDPEGLEAVFVRDYLCGRCQAALLRTQTYLAG